VGLLKIFFYFVTHADSTTVSGLQQIKVLLIGKMFYSIQLYTRRYTYLLLLISKNNTLRPVPVPVMLPPANHPPANRVFS
jgi:hypothetical protein